MMEVTVKLEGKKRGGDGSYKKRTASKTPVKIILLGIIKVEIRWYNINRTLKIS